MRSFPSQVLTVLAAAATLTTLLTSCSSEQPVTPGATAYVHSARANTAALDATQVPDLTELARRSATDRDIVTVVTTDGQPTTGTTLQIRNTGNSSPVQAQQDATNTTTILTAITQSPATTPEANPLRGITIAADAIHHTTGTKTLVIIDSGLQTVAPLRFQDGLLAAGTDPAQVCAFTQAVGAIPDLTGIDITWIGLGKTQDPQTPLTTPASAKLKAIWETILQAGQPASLKFVDSAIPPAPAPGQTPTVTPVTVPDLASYSNPQPTAPPVTASFQADQLGFVADQATFTDSTRAQQIIAQAAATLINGGYHDIHIVGTTADAGPLDGQTELATNRALAVRDLLIAAGVQADNITDIHGAGSQFPGYIPDHNTDGTLNETNAALNRLVIITAT